MSSTSAPTLLTLRPISSVGHRAREIFRLLELAMAISVGCLFPAPFFEGFLCSLPPLKLLKRKPRAGGVFCCVFGSPVHSHRAQPCPATPYPTCSSALWSPRQDFDLGQMKKSPPSGPGTQILSSQAFSLSPPTVLCSGGGEIQSQREKEEWVVWSHRSLSGK